jgi:hypothetical protein
MASPEGEASGEDGACRQLQGEETKALSMAVVGKGEVKQSWSLYVSTLTPKIT